MKTMLRIVSELDVLQSEVDALKRLPGESKRGLHPTLATLLTATLDKTFKGEL